MKNGNLVTTIEIKDRHGRVVDTKEVVTYAGLLNRATQDNLKKVYTELIQLPSEGNQMTAISMAEVVTDRGVFRDYGDANPENVSSMIVPHIIRMAVTRAKARALRDAVNIGVVALEELDVEYQNGAVDNNRSETTTEKKNDQSQSANDKSTHENNQQDQKLEDVEKPMTDNQRRYLFRLLAERGLSGTDAGEWLKEKFNVNNLKQASKAAASDLIEGILSGEVNVEEGAPA